MRSPTPEDTPTETTETLLTEVHARLHLLKAAGPKTLVYCVTQMGCY